MAAFLVFSLLQACQKPTESQSATAPIESIALFAPDNLVAWCVVPFDNQDRGPEARAQMLQELGFTKFAYDWRDRHLPEFPREVEALRQHQVELTSVWWWIDGQSDDLLGDGNRQLLQYMDSLQISCDIWMSFDDRFFEGLDDSQMLTKATEAIVQLSQEASRVGSRLQLYNHGSWFGDPRNQIRIIEASGISDIGIIYNFHHGHDQIDEFAQLLDLMMPYLNTVNINGMNPNGPKILTVGQGVAERDMLATLKASGFKGNIGIIGHLENEDVRVVLDRNLIGLQEITSNL
jgi:hypothetical protein